MSDNNREYNEEPVDLKLEREIRHLDREIQPARNLWPGIERRIADHPQRRWWRQEFLMGWGVAASLLVAVTSLIVSLQIESPAEPVPMETSLESMQAEYLRVRNPMTEQFNQANEDLDPDTLEDLYRNIRIMEEARREIEAQIKRNPENRRLVEMLMRINEQELEVLSEDYSRAGRSM
ncbi:MAG: hypothetical protein HUJ31_19720 [Pseudomonadales bacterium]|nr:hypothetical protein [Pseudomonadales bacterium]